MPRPDPFLMAVLLLGVTSPLVYASLDDYTAGLARMRSSTTSAPPRNVWLAVIPADGCDSLCQKTVSDVKLIQGAAGQLDAEVHLVDCRTEPEACLVWSSLASDTSAAPHLLVSTSEDANTWYAYTGRRDVESLRKALQVPVADKPGTWFSKASGKFEGTKVQAYRDQPKEGGAGTAVGVISSMATLDAAVATADAKEPGNMLVEFYVPSCPFCQDLAPKLDEVSLELERSHGVGVFKVNCQELEEVCDMFDVTGYPTILLRHESAWYEYAGEHEVSAIKTFALEGFDGAHPVRKWVWRTGVPFVDGPLRAALRDVLYLLEERFEAVLFIFSVGFLAGSLVARLRQCCKK